MPPLRFTNGGYDTGVRIWMAICGEIPNVLMAVLNLIFVKVKHHMENHFPGVGCWRMLLPHEDEQARQSEKALLELDSAVLPSDQVVWICMHCQDLPTELLAMSLPEVENHLIQKYVVRFTFWPQFQTGSYMIFQTRRLPAPAQSGLRKRLCCA